MTKKSSWVISSCIGELLIGGWKNFRLGAVKTGKGILLMAEVWNLVILEALVKSLDVNWALRRKKNITALPTEELIMDGLREY